MMHDALVFFIYTDKCNMNTCVLHCESGLLSRSYIRA